MENRGTVFDLGLERHASGRCRDLCGRDERHAGKEGLAPLKSVECYRGIFTFPVREYYKRRGLTLRVNPLRNLPWNIFQNITAVRFPAVSSLMPGKFCGRRRLWGSGSSWFQPRRAKRWRNRRSSMA